MSTWVFVDSNIWNLLFAHQIQLHEELPSPTFQICLSRELEMELPAGTNEKAELRAFIDATLQRCQATVQRYFGFFDDRHSAEDQRTGGWDTGYWAGDRELKFFEQQSRRLSAEKRRTGLFRNEADIDLASRSFEHVVLTLDRKPGALADAHNEGGRVIFLTDFDPQATSLGAFVQASL